MSLVGEKPQVQTTDLSYSHEHIDVAELGRSSAAPLQARGG
jgi:hypothetical protein